MHKKKSKQNINEIYSIHFTVIEGIVFHICKEQGFGMFGATIFISAIRILS